MMAIPDSSHMTIATIFRMVAALLSFCAMVTCVLWAVVVNLDRVEKVNECLPAGQKLGYPLGFLGPEKHWRFEKEYERLYPDHALRNKERILYLFGALALVSFVFCISPFL